MASKAAARAYDRSPLRQLGGFLICMTAAYLLVCLLTYTQADPSLNRATHTRVANSGGYAGAILADVILQVLGFASCLLAIVPLSWGWKMTIGRRVSHLWLRSSMLLLACVLLAATLSPLEPFMSWPIESGYGGAMGKLIHDSLPRFFRNPLFQVFLVAGTVFSIAQSFGMTAGEWRAVGRLCMQGIMITYALLSHLLPRRLRLEDEEDYEDYEEIEEEYEDEEPWYRRLAASAKDKLMFWRREDDEEEEEEDDEVMEDDEEEIEEDDEESERPRKRSKPARSSSQQSLALPRGDFVLPALTLLASPPKSRRNSHSESALQQNARLLENAFKEFGVNGTISQVHPGPVVTLYELEPAPGIKSSRVIGLADDIARSMSAVSARIAVIPGRNAIGIELPNATRETVYLREMLENDSFETNDAKLPLALGKDIGGAPIIVDLARMPHLLVAGTTGSGKSVAINTMILSLAYRLSPEECRFIMIDPKMLELSIYDGIPHLLTPVVTEPGKAVVALKWTVREMENRYRLMANLSVRNIDSYNRAIREAKARGHQLTRRVQTGFDPETGNPIIEEAPLDMMELPYIVVIVDEMADLMITSGKEIEASVQRLAQMARAAGIHIIMATQRPSVDIITGVIKANFPTRVSFQVITKVDSRTILGEQGAEQLLGQGDMLYMAGGGRITRVHGPFVSDREVEAVVAHLKEQGEPTYIEDVTRDDEADSEFPGEDSGERDEMYDQAVAIVARDRKASTSYIQRCLKIGYNRAASIIDRMEREGVVGAANHVGKREVLVREEA